jgi:hypothetical protein
MRHEATLHSDESVFFNSASSVFRGDYSFQYAKDYPGGAFVFQMPFQFIGTIEQAVSPGGLGEREYGRLASIFYFSVACLMGGVILYRNFGKKPLAVFFYALTMVFSLFQILESRYGTGDAISFFVLMVIIYSLDIFFKEEDGFYLYFAAFFTGVIAAIKFPLIFFIIYPICAFFIKMKQLGIKKSPLKAICGIVVFALVGLLLFSPHWFIDKTFFMKAFFREMDAYFLSTDGFESTPINHFAHLLIYQLLYADFPFAMPLFVVGIVSMYRQNKKHGFTNVFYTLVLPASIFLFFFYNLFASSVVFRTYYPYFCLCVFFTSYALSELFSRKNCRIIIIVLSVFMVLRGSFLIYTLTEESRGQLVVDALTQHEEWDNRRMVVTYGGPPHVLGYASIPERKYVYERYVFLYGNPTLQPGEFGVTGNIEYGVVGANIFRSGEATEKLRLGWVSFREQNKDYLIGVSYPPYFHYIFGGWIPGSDLGWWEFPVNYIYYRPYETGEKAPNPQKYYHLYEIDGWREYLEAIARIDCTIILSGSEGLPEDFVREVFAVFPVDVDVSLLPGQASAFVIQPANAEQSLIFSQNNEEATMLLTKTIGAQSSISVSAESNVITIDDRYYATYAPGFNIVVYDNNMKCVMDWRSLIFDANSGNVALYK